MADESQVLRSIDWRSTFPFTNIFRGFRVAIHPSKLILALLALVLIYGGGRLLDSFWPRDYRAVPDEIDLYESTRIDPNPAESFTQQRLAIRTDLDGARKTQLVSIGKPDGEFSDIKWRILRDRDDAVASAERSNSTSKAAAKMDAYRLANAAIIDARKNDGFGLFFTAFSYEMRTVNTLIGSVVQNDWVGSGGVFASLTHAVLDVPMWAARHHTVFFIVFGLWFLCIWSIFGGAIARIAAVHIARDEKISIRQSLAFSISKFLSFVSAPLIPLIIVFGLGLLVAIGGAIGNIPGIGPSIVGVLFFLPLAAGFVMTLVIIGAVGGLNLMYPTIAVEGSDSFDAISRSFSYLYARPWRLGFYSLISLIYGALSFLFVRLFIGLMLWLTHAFAGAWFRYHAENGGPLFNTMWPTPFASMRLMYDIDYTALTLQQSFAASVMAVWVYLVVLMLGAFAISFYFSVNTIIYFLMRAEVDATELDDVYLEQVDDEFADPIANEGDASTVVVTTEPIVSPDAPPAV